MQKSKKIKSKILIVLFFVLFFLCAKNALADSCDDTCDNYFSTNGVYPNGESRNNCVDNCEGLEKKAKIYEDLIKLKNKQQSALADQLDSINSEQAKTLTQLQAAQTQVQTLQQQIDSLEQDIKDKGALMELQKKMLAGFMQSYYEYDQQGVLPVVLANKDFSDVFNQADYLQQSGSKVSTTLAEILAIRQSLRDNQDALKQKKIASDNAKADLIDKKESLQATENQKTNLLAQTQGEEEKYKQLLARVEAQKQELFDFSTASNLDDVVGSVDSYTKPDNKYWDSDNFFSQRDSRWGDAKIGGTKYLMKDFGCAVTSVAMMYQFNGKNYTPKTILSRADFTSQALIYWPDGWKSTSFDAGAVDNQLKDGNVVIVHIKKGSTAGHFVVIHHKPSNYKSINDYVVHDPYFGANLYLGTSRALIGRLGKDGSTTIDKMIIYN